MNKISIILMLVLLLSLAIAQEKYYDPFDASTWDYTDEDFYQKIAPAMWDYKKVNWDKIDISDDRLYLVDAFWENLPDDKAGEIDAAKVILLGKGNKLSTAQIAANFDEIDDLSKVNKKRAEQAIMDTYGVNVGFAGGARIQNDVFKATFGAKDYVPINHPLYKNGLLWVNRDGEISFTPNEQEIESIPIEASFSIASRNRPLILPNGVKVNGESYHGNLYFTKGEFYADPAAIIRMDGVDIRPTDWRNTIKYLRLFFDGEEHKDCECSYVSLNRRKKGGH